MFLSSYEKLREKVINNRFIDTMLHLGPRAFEEIGGEVVQSVTFILRNTTSINIEGKFVRLVQERTAGDKRAKLLNAIQNDYSDIFYLFNQNNFKEVPGSPIAYWISNTELKAFKESPLLDSMTFVKKGMFTGDDNNLLKLWHEVNINSVGFNFKNTLLAHQSGFRWFPLKKGGNFRKWYGNSDYVVAFSEKDYEQIRINKGHRSPEFYFKKALTWTKITNSNFSCRYEEEGFVNSDASMSIFEKEIDLRYVMGILNSKVGDNFLKIINSTISYQAGDLKRVPIIKPDVEKINRVIAISQELMELSKLDWDYFETSWEFKMHPLLECNTIKSAFEKWTTNCMGRFNQLKANEEELNRIFIEIYGLQGELTPKVEEKDISIHKADLERDVKSFISYAIGCSLGRYSLDEEGLIYAGGEFDALRYKTFQADADNILPILSGAYFEDDIVTKFINFVRITFSEETLEENLDFIADAIGRKKTETAREAIRRYFLNDFFKDHVQTYKKRPIYWLFTSGKEKAFNCLIYMHRYDKTTLSRIRTDYVHEVQNRMDAEKNDLLNIINGDSTVKEIATAKKELKSLEKKIDELKKYDEQLHHMADQQIEIDLDDGVKHNYELFKGLVAPIK